MNHTSPVSMGSGASPSPVRSALDQRKQFTCPKEPKKDRDNADERLWNALDKVPDTVHFETKDGRETATLYMGYIEFKASISDLSYALNTFFKWIGVEKVTIPQRNGRSLGYAFIELSWAAGAPVKMFDI